MTPDVTILAALLAGLISFLSPCVLPLVPPYLVYLAGTSLERLTDDDPQTGSQRQTVAAAALFVLGFSTVFVALCSTNASFPKPPFSVTTPVLPLVLWTCSVSSPPLPSRVTAGLFV